MKKYIKIKFKYPTEKITEEHAYDARTAYEYLKSINKQESKKIEEELGNIISDKMINVIMDFIKTFLKGIRHYKNPIEIFYTPKESALILTNKEANSLFHPTKEIALEQLEIIKDSFGCDIAYYGVETLTAYEIVKQYIKNQTGDKNE